jgi:hypothetical protein
MPGGGMECERTEGCWNRELALCSHELRRVGETSEVVEESMSCGSNYYYYYYYYGFCPSQL